MARPPHVHPEMDTLQQQFILVDTALHQLVNRVTDLEQKLMRMQESFNRGTIPQPSYEPLFKVFPNGQQNGA